MLLDSLAQYYRCQAPLPFAYKEVAVPWIVHLTDGGKLVPPIQRTSGQERRSGSNPGQVMPAPGLLIPRTSGARATLLVDRADYSLGFPGRGADEEAVTDVRRNHGLFLAVLRECYLATAESLVLAVLNFLEGPENTLDNYPLELAPRDVVGFMVNGVPPQNRPSVQRFWAAYQAEATTGQSDAPCLVCGNLRPIARRHPNVKGIPGGQTSGLTLVSANLPAFESYGLEASLNAPVCLECAEAYTKGINALLCNHAGAQLREGNVVYLFWDQKGNHGRFASLLGAPSRQGVESLVLSCCQGMESSLQREVSTRFYAAAVSASGSRVVLRDWLETTVQTAYHHLARYFILQRLPGQEPFSLFRLRQGLTPPHSSHVVDQVDSTPLNIIRWLVRCALLGEVLPDALIYHAVRRNRAEQGVLPARAALIKMVILSSQLGNDLDKEGAMDENVQNHPAYLCGRLLALLEQAQGTALGYRNATLVGRFYGLASSAPASVFGLLLRNIQPYLSRLRHGNVGMYNYLQREMGKVIEQLCTFPSTLDLRSQGIFALGYYYQRQERFRRREATETPMDADGR